MIFLSEENSIFILDFNRENNELTFVDIKNKHEVQKEIITINEDDPEMPIVLTSNYHFSVGYINKFLIENNEHGK